MHDLSDDRMEKAKLGRVERLTLEAEGGKDRSKPGRGASIDRIPQ